MASHDTLTKTGEALYGPRWQSELAKDLGVSDRTMRRWVAGDSEPPEGVYDDMRALIRERIKLLKALAAARKE